jgi:4-amino-4-deoxy-L-arabinose transferase-like glycosyltransferase
VLLSLRAHERATAGAFALAGVAVGLAAATKYNGAVALVVPLLCCAMTPAARPSRTVAILWTFAGMMGAFLLAAPYTFLELPVFLNQFARLSAEYRTVTPGLEQPGLIYLKHLRNALGWPGTVIVIAGLVFGAFRALAGPSRVQWLVAIVFPLVYFRFISSQHIIYGRYLLPLLPLLSLLGATAIVAVVDSLRHRGLSERVRVAVVAALAVLAIAPPAYTSIAFDADAAREWTTEQAYHWILAGIPKGSKVTMESRQIRLPDGMYRTSFVPQLRLRPFDQYVDQGAAAYLVASSQVYGPYFDAASGGPQKYPQEYAEYVALFNRAEEVARFTPSAAHPGPELRIFRIKGTMP